MNAYEWLVFNSGVDSDFITAIVRGFTPFGAIKRLPSNTKASLHASGGSLS